MSKIIPERLYTVKELALYLRMNKNSIHRYLWQQNKAGEYFRERFKAQNIDGEYFFRGSDILL